MLGDFRDTRPMPDSPMGAAMPPETAEDESLGELPFNIPDTSGREQEMAYYRQRGEQGRRGKLGWFSPFAAMQGADKEQEMLSELIANRQVKTYAKNSVREQANKIFKKLQDADPNNDALAIRQLRKLSYNSSLQFGSDFGLGGILDDYQKEYMAKELQEFKKTTKNPEKEPNIKEKIAERWYKKDPSLTDQELVFAGIKPQREKTPEDILKEKALGSTLVEQYTTGLGENGTVKQALGMLDGDYEDIRNIFSDKQWKEIYGQVINYWESK